MHLLAMLTSVRTTFYTMMRHTVWRVACGVWRVACGQFIRYPTSISALAFNHDGSYLAIASSYTYEEGEKEHPADAIFIHETSDTEVKPK